MKTGRPREYIARTPFTTTLEAEQLNRLKKVSQRDGKQVNIILKELIDKHLKIHEDGNTQYTLDDPVMAYPAFGRPYSVIEKYFLQLKDNEFEEHKFKLQEWCGAFKKRYGVYPI